MNTTTNTLHKLKNQIVKKSNQKLSPKMAETLINNLIEIFADKDFFKMKNANGKINYSFSKDFESLALASIEIRLDQEKSKYLLRCTKKSVSYEYMTDFFYALLAPQNADFLTENLYQRIDNILKLVNAIIDAEKRYKILPAYMTDFAFKKKLFFYILSASDFELPDGKFTYKEILETIEKATQTTIKEQKYTNTVYIPFTCFFIILSSKNICGDF